MIIFKYIKIKFKINYLKKLKMGNNLSKKCLFNCNCNNELKEKKLEVNPYLLSNSNDNQLNINTNFMNSKKLTKNNNLNLKQFTIKNNIKNISRNKNINLIQSNDLNQYKNKEIYFQFRKGKNYLLLLKEINFSLKIISKINKLNISNFDFLSSNFQSLQSDFSSNSGISISNSSTNNYCKVKTYKKTDLTFENLSKFKNLFFIPVISLNGEINNYFEVCKNDFDDNIFFISFSIYLNFDYLIFKYLVNLFSNFSYKNYKEVFILLFNYIENIEKISIVYNPNKNICSICLINISDDIYKIFIKNDSLMDYFIGEKNKKIEKDRLIIHFSSKISNNFKYEVIYNNYLSNEELFECLLIYLNNINIKENNKYLKIIENFKEAQKLHMKNIKLIQFISINYNEIDSKYTEINKIKIKVKTNNELIIRSKTLNSINSFDKINLNNKNNKNSIKNPIIKINSNYTKVKYFIINITNNKVFISYEYEFV